METDNYNTMVSKVEQAINDAGRKYYVLGVRTVWDEKDDVIENATIYTFSNKSDYENEIKAIPKLSSSIYGSIYVKDGKVWVSHSTLKFDENGNRKVSRITKEIKVKILFNGTTKGKNRYFKTEKDEDDIIVWYVN